MEAQERSLVQASAQAPARPAVTAPSKPAGPKRFIRQQVPDDILHNAELNRAIAVLPANYNFEIPKTVWRIRQASAKHVALQFPEGLLMYACIISDILERHAGADQCSILGDVTYGACCVDDFSAKALDADFLVHYGHSCLVPVDVTGIPCLYVFVDIGIDLQHLVETVRLNFPPDTSLALAGTVQFAASIQSARQQLSQSFASLAIPQAKPLSPGEVLGCTAPTLPTRTDALVFVADGRFHLEAIMIANPTVAVFRYDPYARLLLREQYDHVGMRRVRRGMVQRARVPGQRWGVIQGTLGRQGNPHTFDRVCDLLRKRDIQFMLVLLSEVTPAKLDMMPEVDVWVQVACPRLSIDWGEGFGKPTLTPYEAFVALGEAPEFWKDEDGQDRQADQSASSDVREDFVPYPMDYYAKDGGVWSSSYHRQAQRGTAGVQLNSRTLRPVVQTF
ncbi:hypothetical protein WJX73_009622 [Symbiochloris irregularis]|uniref:2-(3-amino-3-carboxypropyl)histidine synthase subunit 1 n=1 Tax=Symbiochloris irregularis TaxID=706552 RepID=A0AAW1P8E4_9CHLO